MQLAVARGRPALRRPPTSGTEREKIPKRVLRQFRRGPILSPLTNRQRKSHNSRCGAGRCGQRDILIHLVRALGNHRVIVEQRGQSLARMIAIETDPPRRAGCKRQNRRPIQSLKIQRGGISAGAKLLDAPRHLRKITAIDFNDLVQIRVSAQ